MEGRVQFLTTRTRTKDEKEWDLGRSCQNHRWKFLGLRVRIPTNFRFRPILGGARQHRRLPTLANSTSDRQKPGLQTPAAHLRRFRSGNGSCSPGAHWEEVRRCPECGWV